ncbi:MAG: hypothetical protein HY459_01785 [Parcubacteria group bacterium]|nr:hypothetical protein [Parcubacteria group bacterium]
MIVQFAFEKVKSEIIGEVYRPVARAMFFSPRDPTLSQETSLLIDSGSDFTLLPLYFGRDLKIDFAKECRVFYTSGIGGKERVYFLPTIKVQLGPFIREIPVGFIGRNDVPPLMGRHLFLEAFETYFAKNRIIYFSDQPFRQ